LSNTKVFSRVRTLTLLAAALVWGGGQAAAQPYFGLDVALSSSPAVTNVPLTYTLTVTNLSGIQFFNPGFPAFVTNTFSGPVQWLAASCTLPLFTVSSNSAGVVFNLGTFPSGFIVQMTVTALPTAAGSVTNQITVAAPGSFTNLLVTNVVTAVTNVLGPTNASADLAIALSGPTSSIITNDWMSYGVTVVNLGTNDASNVILSNALPAGVGYIDVWPSTLTPTEADTNVVFNLGTVSNGAAAYLALRVQPTNAGTLAFSSVVGSQDVPDPDPANNVAATNIAVTRFLSGQLTVGLVDATQQFNPQTGLMEQRASLNNVGTNPVSYSRLTVLGLTNWMFNAAGTNNGNPYVVYASSLTNGESVELLLEYFNPFGLPAAFTSLQANEVPFVSLAPPALLGTSVTISNVIQMPSGDVLLEFPAFTNRSYTVVYYDNDVATNPMVALPSYLSPANWVQWIDYGPPKTITRFTNTTSRAYSVFLNP
jgi:uncharacterized repeat protein (TIGR01451 family)